MTPELVEELFERMAKGESVNSICRDDRFPSPALIWKMSNRDEDFRKRYADAREALAHYYAEDIVEIASTERDASVARNMIDARKWYAAKCAPKVYGDKSSVDHTTGGESLNRPITHRDRAKATLALLRKAQDEAK